MSQLEKMKQVYEKIKVEVLKNGNEDYQAREVLNSDLAKKIVNDIGLKFPFSYASEEEGVYYFGDFEAFQEYLIERLYDEEVIVSDDYYESSEDWDYSSC